METINRRTLGVHLCSSPYSKDGIESGSGDTVIRRHLQHEHVTTQYIQQQQHTQEENGGEEKYCILPCQSPTLGPYSIYGAVQAVM